METVSSSFVSILMKTFPEHEWGAVVQFSKQHAPQTARFQISFFGGGGNDSPLHSVKRQCFPKTLLSLISKFGEALFFNILFTFSYYLEDWRSTVFPFHFAMCHLIEKLSTYRYIVKCLLKHEVIYV